MKLDSRLEKETFKEQVKKNVKRLFRKDFYAVQRQKYLI